MSDFNHLKCLRQELSLGLLSAADLEFTESELSDYASWWQHKAIVAPSESLTSILAKQTIEKHNEQWHSKSTETLSLSNNNHNNNNVNLDAYGSFKIPCDLANFIRSTL